MTPRTESTWGGIEADGEGLLRAVARRRFSRVLIGEDSVDNAVGILHTKDVLPLALKNEPIAVRAAMVPAVIVPDRTSVLQLLDRFRSEEHTSELQSLMRISYAVFCLKKKKKTTTHTRHQHKQ